MKDQKRALRRYHARRKQSRRLKMWSYYRWFIESDSIRGQLKKTHFGCGCFMCKPWKHKMDEKYKPSERRRLPF